jgi:hypothetical protein
MKKFITSDLYVDEQDGVFVLLCGGEPVLTSGGSKVSHREPDLIKHMLVEFNRCGEVTLENQRIVEPRFVSSYAFFSIQKDFVEHEKDDLTLDFASCLTCDGTLFRCAGPEGIEQMYRWGPITSYLKDLGLVLPSLIGPFFDDPENYDSEEEYAEAKELAEPSAEFTARVKREYELLNPAQKAVVMMLYACHQGMVLFPLTLVKGRCTPNEYASGVIASKFAIAGVFPDVDSNEHRQMFTELTEHARTAVDFLDAQGLYSEYKTADQKLLAEIAEGETILQEFKTTLRWNIRAEKNDDAITHSCLKTLTAFINSDGGKLFIGIDDDGTPVGIELDKFANNDKFLLHLNNEIKQAMGETAATLVEATMHVIKNKTVCRIECRPNSSDTPVFLKFRKNEEELFVRTGPATTRLPPSQILEFMKNRKIRSNIENSDQWRSQGNQN